MKKVLLMFFFPKQAILVKNQNKFLGQGKEGKKGQGRGWSRGTGKMRPVFLSSKIILLLVL